MHSFLFKEEERPIIVDKRFRLNAEYFVEPLCFDLIVLMIKYLKVKVKIC